MNEEEALAFTQTLFKHIADAINEKELDFATGGAISAGLAASLYVSIFKAKIKRCAKEGIKIDRTADALQLADLAKTSVLDALVSGGFLDEEEKENG